jgi:hypothetical protein
MYEQIRNKEVFIQRFFEDYFKYGLGSLSKKEVDILILKLILEDLLDKNNQELDVFKLARDLKISVTKLRNLIKEVQIRFNQVSDDVVKRRIVYIFQTNRWKLEGNQIHISIVDPLLRERFLELIYKANSFADYSFNNEILKIDIDVFVLIISNLSGKSLDEIISSLPDLIIKDEKLVTAESSNVVIKNIITKNFSLSINFDMNNVIGLFINSLFNF